jgi:signal transduction histidine kinase
VQLADGPLTVNMNPIQIEQVVVNLLQNAMESGEWGVRVTVRTEGAPDAVRVIVSDTGRGITPEHQSRMFDPFFTTRLHLGGTGLGLSIVHGIITEHGGTIDVQSRLGEGTTITVALPRHTENDGTRPPSC